MENVAITNVCIASTVSGCFSTQSTSTASRLHRHNWTATTRSEMQPSRSSSRPPSILRLNSSSTSMALSAPKHKSHLRATSANRKVRSSNRGPHLEERICHPHPRRIFKDRHSRVLFLRRLQVSRNHNWLSDRRQALAEPLLKWQA